LIDADAFAREWIAAWNAHDLDRILAHYAEGVVFSSPKAATITGSSRVTGKAALRAYWQQALARSPHLQFELERIYSGADCISIAYVRNGALRVCETLEFENNLVVRGSVAHTDM
jgi:ketosteroid isomerase-like protein